MANPSMFCVLCACAVTMVGGACAGTGAAKAPAGPAAGAGSAVASRPAAPRPAAGPASKPATPAALLISERGVGTISGIKYTSDDQLIEAVRAALKTVPGLTVELSVMDIRGREVETEEGYIAVSRGQTEVLQVLRPGFADMRGGEKLEVHALDPMFATTAGVRQGDRVEALRSRRKGVSCSLSLNDRLGDLTCSHAKEPNIVYVIDAEGFKGKSGAVDPAAIASRKIIEIVWGCDSWCER